MARSWKNVEREIAKRLGGERIPVSGRQRGWAADVQHPWMALEVKSRKTGYAMLADAMDQARKAAEWALKREEKVKLPVVVYHVDGTHYDNALVIMRLGDFEDWFLNEEVKE